MRFRSVLVGDELSTVAVVDEHLFAIVDEGRAVDESLGAGALRELWAGWRPDLDSCRQVKRSVVARTAPLVRSPEKLWGIGLNYREHAGDLGEDSPLEPASFLKGRHTLIGADDAIIVPQGDTGTTAEAELGLVIGSTAYCVDRSDALQFIGGVCLILDQTAETILRRNPRFLTRSKNYPTFLSVGPDLITLDEALAPFDGALANIVVETRLNGELVRANRVANMMFPPDYLVAFHSCLMPLYPGDVICTGTPGAVVVTPGDIAECRIPSLGQLRNLVVGADDPIARAQIGELLV